MTSLMTHSNPIVAEALTWVDTPYHHAAKLKGSGVDCAQLLYAVFIDALHLVPPIDFSEYPSDWMWHRSEEIFLSHVQTSAQEVFDPQPGDVAMFKWGHCFAHGSIVMDWPFVIHACVRTKKVTLIDARQGKFADREVRFFRVDGEGA